MFTLEILGKQSFTFRRDDSSKGVNMGNISSNKLGGLGLIIGPGLATLLFLIIFVALGDAGSGDPTDFTDFTKQSSLEGFLGMLPGISLIFFLYGLMTLGNDIKQNGNNESLFQLGLLGVFFGILGIIVATSLGTAVNFDNITVGAGYESIVNLVGGAIQTYTGLLFAIGTTLVAIALSTNKVGAHKIFAWLVALLGAINIVVGFVNLLDASTWESTFISTPITYLTFSIWSVTLGLNLVKKA